MAGSLNKAAGNQSQARDIQRTDEYHPACCQKHPLDQHTFAPPFLHQIQPRKRKEKKKNSKPRVEALIAQPRERRMLSPQIF
ncbi:unnamed protein product [Prunus armeniaca]